MRWSVTLDLAPITKGRPLLVLVRGRPRLLTQNKTRAASKLMKDAILAASPVMFTGPICVSIDFTFTRPKSVSEKKRPHPSCKPDVDNVCKMVFDAGTGLLWKDDAQIVTLLARKIYGAQASTKITVWAKDRMRKPGRCG